MILGIDTGGTFTDFVLFDGETLRTHKVLSTPAAPERAILQGIAELGLTPSAALTIVHGSTVATNALLEGKGVRTAFITNHGLGDMLTIGRQARAELYNLQPKSQPIPVPHELCLETGGRLGADASVVEPLDEAELSQLVERLAQLNPQAVAINLLFSFLDSGLEERIEAAIRQRLPGLFISRSSAILPEYKEYERGIATWLNAWVGPLVEGYLQRLQAGVGNAPLSVMQSSGTTIEAQQAGREAVRMLLSGPAGGLAGAKGVGERAGSPRLLTFDMGGTSTDVALIDGELQLTSEGRIGGYPVAVPMVDMHTIGAGGGSIARVDGGGLLQVGPESAGAAPGPACYDNGGIEPTVTDANLVLGRLLPGAFLGGEMRLDVEAARRAVDRVAEPLGITIEEAAEGILRVANEHMARALRVMSVERGVDPRQLTLACFGGAGGLHVCALAEALGMGRAIVPIHAGVLSALGMLMAPRGRQLVQTHRGLWLEMDRDEIETLFARLAEQGINALQREGVDREVIEQRRSLDLRYLGQSYTLTVEWRKGEGVERVAERFHAHHQGRYGHRLERPVELVNLRLALSGPQPQLPIAAPRGNSKAAAEKVVLYGVGEVSCHERDALRPGQRIEGPALIREKLSTTYLAQGWDATMEAGGSLLLSHHRE